MSAKTITRREFLKTGAAGAAAGALYLNQPARLFAGEKPVDGSRVVLIRSKDVLDGDLRVRPEPLTEMLDEAVVALTGENDAASAWGTIAGAGDVVGIKTNVWNYLSTPESLEHTVTGRLIEAGVDEAEISVDDRGIRSNPVFKKSTVLVNARPLRTHHWAGVGTLLKNYIMFVDTPSAYHPDSCADLAKIWKLPQVEGKTRLNILVALTPLFHGVGPHHYNPKYVWGYGGLLVGFDPVAVDATGVRILNAKRTEYFGEDRPINPPPKHVFLADTRHHLGTADPEKIELIKLGWSDGALI
ncbi:MAG: DUF362 domain-containing protein [Candidatus Latescibacterota bacterium]|jgi:hypothetical protein